MKFYNKRNKSMVASFRISAYAGKRWPMTEKGNKGAFWGAGGILYLDLGGGCVGEYICKTLLSCTLKISAFYVYVLYFNF